jgi:hypothetical protein
MGHLTNLGFRTKFVIGTDESQKNSKLESESISISKLKDLTSERLPLVPKLIKIDIEGDEYSIVEGLLHEGYRPEIWIVEVVDQHGSEHVRREPQNKLNHLMQTFNYSMKLMDGVNEWYVAGSARANNLNVWAPAYPGVESFIPFHLTINYRIRNFIHFKRDKLLKKILRQL